MYNMVVQLNKNGVVEEKYGPWGTLVVLYEKKHQENVPWREYHWRLYVSYRKLNQVTRSFPLPTIY